MKLRYYLRGLGIGVVVTAMIMGFVKGGGKETLTDEEIIARAEKLGMVESSVLATDLATEKVEEQSEAEKETEEEAQAEEAPKEADKKADEDAKAEADMKSAEEAKAEIEKNAEEAKAKEEAKAESDQKKDQSDDQKKESEKTQTDSGNTEKRYVVTVYGGDGSRTVANRLQDLGVIKDAAAFDDYLCKNGYDKRITTGNHEIKAGASLNEIAEALVKKVD